LTQLLEKLKLITKAEKIEISQQDLQKIALASLGGFRDAETLLQQVAEGEISVDSLVGMGSKEIYTELTDHLIEGEVGDAIRIVSKVYEEGLDLYVWIGEYLRYLRELLFIKSGVKDEVTGATSEIMADMEVQARRVSFDWLLAAISCLLEEHKNIKSSFIPQLPVEIALSKMGGAGNSELQITGLDSPVIEDGEEEDAQDSPTKPTIRDRGRREGRTDTKSKNKKDVRLPPAVTMELLEQRWKEFIKQSRELNHSITALLKSSKPIDIEGNFVILEVFYPFHKERLESPNNRKLVEKLMSEIYETGLSIRCQLSKNKPGKVKTGESGNLTDLNIAPSEIRFNKETVIETFDGGLPLI
jgi:DNA polymerase III gamma/tau subunit